MLVITITTFIILHIILTSHVTSAMDNNIVRELLQRMDKMQSHMDWMQRQMEKIPNEMSKMQGHMDRMQRHVDRMETYKNIRFDQLQATVLKIAANDLNTQGNIKNLSVVMETIVDQQMVITAKISTISQTLPSCCCQSQNKTFKPIDSLPQNCAEAMGESGPDGVYQINVTSSNIGPFDVYCMKNVVKSLEEDIINGTWLIIQRRQDNSTDFYQNWTMYQSGFGDLKENFWIGLDKLYAISNSLQQELWIELVDHDDKKVWARYSHFGMGNETELYELKTLGSYEGTAGDSLARHKGHKWTTLDKDNDIWPKYNCAVRFNAAWWFIYDPCFDSSLNGMYGNNVHGKGIIWGSFRGMKYSLKYAHMAIRPRILK